MSSATTTVAMPSPTQGRLAAFVAFMREELAPRPGRVVTSLRISASVVLALWAGVSWNLPVLGLCLYMNFLVPRDSPAKAVKLLIAIMISCSIAELYTVFIFSLPGDGPAIRFIGGAVMIYLGIFFMQAVATLGPAFLLMGLLADAFIRSWDAGRPAEVSLENNLMLWLTLVVGFASGVVVELLFAQRDSLDSLRTELATSLTASANAMAAWQERKREVKTQKALDGLALKGATKQYELLNAAQSRYVDPGNVGEILLGTIQLTLFLLDQVACMNAIGSDQLTEEDRAALVTMVERTRVFAAAVRNGKPAFSTPLQQPAPGSPLAPLYETLDRIEKNLCGQGSNFGKLAAPPKPEFLKPDAWTNQQYAFNAFKVTLAACICYFIQSVSDWSGIDTIVTTCLVTALGTVGEASEKQVLRVTGDSIAGVVALACLAWVLPHFSTIAGLTVVCAIVAYIGAWVFLSSPRLSYAGRQFSYCFYLATLTSTSTPISLTQGRDRVAGVIMGVTVMWLVYDQIAPVWTIDTLRSSLVNIIAVTADVADLSSSPASQKDKLHKLAALRGAFTKEVNRLRRTIEVHGYELIPAERDKKQAIVRLNHVCDLLQRVFLAETVAFEEQIAGTSSMSEEVRTLPKESSSKLRSLVALVKTDKVPPGPADQQPSLPATAYSAIFFDLEITLYALLQTSASRPKALRETAKGAQ